MVWRVFRSEGRLLGLLVSLCLCCLLPASPVHAQNEAGRCHETRYGVALLAGKVYDPQSIGLLLVQGQLLLDYSRVFRHRAPESLRLKLEANAGLTTDGRQRALLSLNMLALKYLPRFTSGRWTPYVEAGIGLIYTDFRVDGQGLNFNFNPQAGVGVEYALPSGAALTSALRLHHVSNGNTYHENRGINSVLLMIGYLF